MIRVKFKIDGLNLNKLINDFINNGIIIEELQIKQRRIAFFVKNQYKTKVELICKKHRKYYKIIQNNNIFNAFYMLRNYFGFVMAIILCFCYMFSFNIYVSKINLSYKSDVAYDLEKVDKLLGDYNVYSGMLKKDVCYSKIESLILSNFNDISNCYIKLNGGVLDIVVYPSTAASKPNDKDVISKFNAVISSVDIYAGIAQVKVGDIVKVGDVLIKNHNGASGVICGKVIFEDYLVYNNKQHMYEKTGRLLEDYSISVFGFNLIKTQNHNAFDLKSIKTRKFYLSKNLFIPIVFNKNFIYEEKIVDVVVPFEDREYELKEELKNKILLKIENKDTIKNIAYSVVSENDYTRLDCFVECEFNLV